MRSVGSSVSRRPERQLTYVPAVPARHLALTVENEPYSRDFYERDFGFGAQCPRRYSDGGLMFYDAQGFALPLGRADGPPRLPGSFHFGLSFSSAPRCSSCASVFGWKPRGRWFQRSWRIAPSHRKGRRPPAAGHGAKRGGPTSPGA